MVGRGFIHDKLEIKFLILYLAARIVEPVPFDTLLELSMCDDGINYFNFSECLADLVRTNHLDLSQDGLYSITEKGMKNSQRGQIRLFKICNLRETWESSREGKERGEQGQNQFVLRIK